MFGSVFQEGVPEFFGMLLYCAEELVGLFHLGFGGNDGLSAVPQWEGEAAIENVGEVPFRCDYRPASIGKYGGPCMSFGFLAILLGAQQDAGDIPVDVIEDSFVISGAAAGSVTSVE
jgi:hypothetical protein